MFINILRNEVAWRLTQFICGGLLGLAMEHARINILKNNF